MKELEDSPHFPAWLRNFQTEFIGFVVSRFDIYIAFIKYINSLLLSKRPMRDLCSGSGEPAISIFKKCNCFSELVLSDKFPNKITGLNDKITYLPQGVDVLELEFQPDAYYTMFNAFHHFSYEEKLKIVQKIHSSGSRSFFVEILEPSLFCLVKVILMGTIGNLLLTPFVKPFSWKRLFFTYIIPINIITITYDGIVSVFKSKNLKAYQKLFSAYGDSVKVFKLSNNLASLIVIEIDPE